MWLKLCTKGMIWAISTGKASQVRFHSLVYKVIYSGIHFDLVDVAVHVDLRGQVKYTWTDIISVPQHSLNLFHRRYHESNSRLRLNRIGRGMIDLLRTVYIWLLINENTISIYSKEQHFPFSFLSLPTAFSCSLTRSSLPGISFGVSTATWRAYEIGNLMFPTGYGHTQHWNSLRRERPRICFVVIAWSPIGRFL